VACKKCETYFIYFPFVIVSSPKSQLACSSYHIAALGNRFKRISYLKPTVAWLVEIFLAPQQHPKFNIHSRNPVGTTLFHVSPSNSVTFKINYLREYLVLNLRERDHWEDPGIDERIIIIIIIIINCNWVVTRWQ
jgi:hypothetical protein